MNTTFCPRRFALLARQYVREHGRGWLMTVLVLAVVQALLVMLLLATSGSELETGAQAFMYYAGLFFSGYLVAHRLHGAWRSREAALVYLMRPAAPFEKWLLATLAALLAWPLLYSAVFAVVYSVGAQISYGIALHEYQTQLGQHPDLSASPPDAARYALFLPFRTSPKDDGDAMLAFYAAQSMLLLIYAGIMGYAAFALTWFRRHAALRALVLLIALGLLTMLCIAIIPSGWANVLGHWASLRARPVHWSAHVVMTLFWVGAPALLWLANWRALLERDLT